MVNWVVGKEYKTRDGRSVVYVGPVKDPTYGNCSAFYGQLHEGGGPTLIRRNEFGGMFSGKPDSFDIIDPSVLTSEEFSVVLDILKHLAFRGIAARMLSERDYIPEYVHKIVETLRKFKNG